MKKIFLTFACAAVVATTFTGCSGASNAETTTVTSEMSDEMFKEPRKNAQIEVVKRDGVVYTVDGDYEISELTGRDDLSEGKRYMMIADVIYLNGGVAGYVNYPQIEKILSVEEIRDDRQEEETEMSLGMSVNGTKVDVIWEDNESVAALCEMVKDEALEIQMSMYSDFEQVGALGTSLPQTDVQTTTKPGDIVLYHGDQIVVFYGSNTWNYTKLGHIEGMSESELEELLGKTDVVLMLENV